MHRPNKLLLLIALVAGLAGCNMPTGPARTTPTEGVIPAYQTVAVILTQTALASSASTPVSNTNTPDLSTSMASATPDAAQASVTASPVLFSPTPLCNLAQAGRPIDVTIPDDTKMDPGILFVKTWRLVNGGSCTWTPNYSIVWFSGDDIGVRHQEALKGNVPPGQSVDISVDMMAPEKPGSYQSNWKLGNERGELYGIGPGGSSPFWVRIEVVALDTPTPTVPLPTLTLTPRPPFTGNVTLEVEQGVNLDNGVVNNDGDDDLLFRVQGDALQIVWENGARGGHSLTKAPSQAECQAASLTADAFPLTAQLAGSYLCVQTSRGLPGSVNLASIDTTNKKLGIAFTVWSVP